MSKISNKVAEALLARIYLRTKNTLIIKDSLSDTYYMRLCKKPIAKLDTDGTLSICTADWDTLTTKSRLNALPGVRVYTCKGQLYLNGNEWDGKWIIVS